MGDTYLNASRQTVSGIELGGHVAYRKFYFNGNFTMLKGEVKIKSGDIDTNKTGGNHVQLYNYGSFVTNEDITISKLTRRPKTNAYGEIGYKPLANLGFNVMYRYAGSRNDVGYDATLGPFGALNQYSVKNYSLVDIGATWQMIKNFTLTLKVENISNANYQEILGYQTRGRSIYLKLNVKW
jgi:vitamin B12 transporter